MNNLLRFYNEKNTSIFFKSLKQTCKLADTLLSLKDRK